MARVRNLEKVNRLREEILSGRYRNLDFLPAEQDIADLFQVSRTTIRRALLTLKNEGLLYYIPRKGMQITSSRESHPAEKTLKKFVLPKFKMNAVAHETLGIFLGICSKAAELSIDISVSFAESKLFINDVVRQYQNGEIQGIICIEYLPEKNVINQIKQLDIPIVIANMEIEADFLSTGMNFRQVGRLAANTLLEAGHRKIAYLVKDHPRRMTQEIIAGVRGRLAEDEIPFKKDWIFDENQVQTELKNLLLSKDGPTAIFATRDTRAAMIYELAGQLHINIPQQLSIISFDNISWNEAEKANLTTIEQPLDDIGGHAVILLQEWCKNGTKPDSFYFNGKLITRNSIDKIISGSSPGCAIIDSHEK